MIVVAAAVPAVAPAREWTRIAVSGGPAPGGEAGETFVELGEPQIAPDGTVYFVGQTEAASALFRWSAGEGVVRVVPSGVAAVEVSPEGVAQVVAAVDFEACAVDATAMLVGSAAYPFEVAVQTGDPVLVGGETWELYRLGFYSDDLAQSMPRRNQSGELAFLARAFDLGVCSEDPEFRWTHGVFATDANGDFAAIAIEGQPAPGPLGGSFAYYYSILQNGAGEVLLTSQIRLGPSGPYAWAHHRWSASQGLAFVAPLSQGGSEFEAAYFADDGSIFFYQEGFGAGATTGIHVLDPENAMHPLLASGDPAPGLPDGSTFASIGWPSFASDDDFAFGATATTPQGSRYGLWTVSNGGPPALRALREEGLTPELSLTQIARGGRIVYATRPAYPALPKIEYHFSDALGASESIAVEGDAFEFGVGDVRASAGVQVFTDASARHAVATVYSSAYEHGLFATTLPEPEAASLAAAVVATLSSLRRRRAAA